jgi:hypothetical protein
MLEKIPCHCRSGQAPFVIVTEAETRS